MGELTTTNKQHNLLYGSRMRNPSVMTASQLPSFSNPPVAETVLGVQFESIQGFTNCHLGRYWDHIGLDSWPTGADAPPAPIATENFGKTKWDVPGHRINFSNKPSARMQLTASDGCRMIQLQRDKFLFNWVGGGEDYPRYRELRPQFETEFARFSHWVQGEADLGEVHPNQWEATYVNVIPRGSVWNDPTDLPEVFRDFNWPPANVADSRLESPAGHWTYMIGEQEGRLHVEMEFGRVGGPEAPDSIVLRLTARGPFESENPNAEQLMNRLDLARKTIVVAFRDITSESAHSHWGILS